MTRYVITQVVEASSLEEAETVAVERLGYDEDYGFNYRFGERDVRDAEPLPALVGAAPLVPEPNVEIGTAAEFAAWWNEQDDDRRAEAFSRIREWQRSSSDCFIRNHDGAMARLAVVERDYAALKGQLLDADVSRETSVSEIVSGPVDPKLLQLGALVVAWPRGVSQLPAYRATFVALEADGIVLFDDPDTGKALRLHSADYTFHLPKGTS